MIGCGGRACVQCRLCLDCTQHGRHRCPQVWPKPYWDNMDYQDTCLYTPFSETEVTRPQDSLISKAIDHYQGVWFHTWLAWVGEKGYQNYRPRQITARWRVTHMLCVNHWQTHLAHVAKPSGILHCDRSSVSESFTSGFKHVYSRMLSCITGNQ